MSTVKLNYTRYTHRLFKSITVMYSHRIVSTDSHLMDSFPGGACVGFYRIYGRTRCEEG